MPAWRREAIKRLPELRKEIAGAETLMGLWIELNLQFKWAYREPRNESLIKRIYSYADWCSQAPATKDAETDPGTAVACAFYEHIPTIPAARDDMPRWFTAEQVLKSRQVFSYFLEEKQFADLLSHMRKHSSRHRGQRFAG